MEVFCVQNVLKTRGLYGLKGTKQHSILERVIFAKKKEPSLH